MGERTLIVCVGNICRSPIGEALWNHRLKQLGKQGSASSAGISARFGDVMHPTSARLLLENGIVADPHGSRPVTNAMLREANLVLVMEHWQRSVLERTVPFARGRIYTLGHWGGFEIPDPMGEPESVFRSVFELIDQGVCEWQQKLNIIGL